MDISIHALREEGDAFPAIFEHRVVTISIHALREEGDNSPTTPTTKPRNFYPRPPRGGRRHVAPDGPRHAVISIHALREEGDSNWTTLA